MSQTSFSGKLCILTCHSFYREIAAAITAEDWDDVTAAAFPVRCGRPPASWDELRPLLDKDCTQVVVLGRACLDGLGNPPQAWPPVRILRQEQCFHLVAGAALVADAVERGAYLTTPAWLQDWPARLAEMGFTPANSREFFQDFARELLLLDTGIDSQAPVYLAALAETVALPAGRIAVGIDHTRLLLTKIVMEWRLEELQRANCIQADQRAHELSDYAMAFDCLSRLAQIMTEEESIDAIKELFRMLFAPEEVHYLRIENGIPSSKYNIPDALLRQMQELQADYTWIPAHRGFLLRIAYGEQLLGVIAVERLAFPEFRERYLNLALVIVGVCGLAIENARIYQQTTMAENTLREHEERLSLATLHNGVGIWDWNLQTQEMIWDDSMYALYHIRREDFSGTEDAWRQSLHPDDLERGDQEVEDALSGKKPFNTEFRVCWPSGEIRYIKAIAKVFRDNLGKPLRMLGTNIDITDRKLLQIELEKQAHTDYLTGVSNRRHFIEQAELELSRAIRYGNPLSIFMMDIDFFKQINDTYGHNAGDTVLKKLAAVCWQTLREVDIIGRLGGEEFAVLLPETGLEEATEVAERLRASLANVKIPQENGPPLQFTVSIGVLSLASKDGNFDSLLHLADNALYEAKKSGRNKVCIAPQ
ncbi:sensor domain-containing diguanylate cyclase [Candidatus Methylobacter oryzae]|uniref:diguanylate cyclase n=1 Tax=Candidatus Methylobacter oryzae TaxID=2497749 RepID=A0ABY3CCS9_9GAMM|nr:diguanylate cyclase [Candidatus Methylobacter oryzae]TRW99737.1 diguanylate cyclase [Candidatus Methylobacter oryzae]